MNHMKHAVLAVFVLLTITNAFSLETKHVFKSNKPHEIAILNDGTAALQFRLDMIARAKKSIDLEYFIYKNDTSGRLLTQALVEKAKAGVKVRIMLDHINTKETFGKEYATLMNQFDIEVRYFNTTKVFHVKKVQYRSHRKLLLIDKKEALTGGRNIGNDYFDLSPEYNFLDRDIYIRGPIVSGILETFEEIWNHKESKILKLKKEGKKLRQARLILKETEADKNYKRRIKSISLEQYTNIDRARCDEVTYISEKIGTGKKIKKNRFIIKEIYRRLLAAKEKVVIDSAYFFTNKEAKAVLKKTMLENGIKVDLLTNGVQSTDQSYIMMMTDDRLFNWVERGMTVYLYKGHIQTGLKVADDRVKKAHFGTHAKSFIFDNRDIMVGTYNLDPRSQNYNAETAVFCDNNTELADALQADVDKKIRDSHKVTTEDEYRKIRFKKVKKSTILKYYLLGIPMYMFPHLI